MKIVGLSVSNFKRIEVAELRPDGQPVEVTGEHEQGKTSLLDSIVAALGGGKSVPEVPVRRGAESARVILDLGELIVERRWTNSADRVGILIVKTKEGASFGKAQEKLAGLIDSLTFDPVGFMALDHAAQRALLLRALGVDLESFDLRRRVIYEERTEAGRALKSAEARLAAAPSPPADTPDSEISTDSLVEALQAAQRTFRENDLVRDAERASRGRRDRAAEDLSRAESRLLAARKALREAEESVATAGAELAKQDSALAEVVAQVAQLQDPPIDEIQGRFRRAEQINRSVRDLLARRDLEQVIITERGNVEALTARLAEIDQEKAAAFAAAPLPVEGLEVTEDGILLDGLPFSQSSQMRRIRVCTRICAALQPELRIALIRAGNDLSAKAMAEFYEECAALGLQPWVERINPTRSDAIEIVAGRVAGADAPQVVDLVQMPEASKRKPAPAQRRLV